MIVVDTNVIAALVMRDTHHSLARDVIVKDAVWRAPMLWQSELANALWKAVRFAGMDVEAAVAAFAEAMKQVQTHDLVKRETALRIACASGHSAYDCEFVAAANELGVALVTFDQRLAGSFPDVAVLVKDWLRA